MFDLDGTLTDSAPGIIASVKVALELDGINAPDEATLRSFVGPPLYHSLSTIYGMDEERCARVVAHYREYFRAHGIFDNKPYEGIPELLGDLKREGAHVVVATSKPRPFAETILEHFSLNKWVDALHGPEFSDDSAADSKERLIKAALAQFTGRPAIMVGDRHLDVEGAHAQGIPAVYALYGYGSCEEAERCGADFIAENVAALRQILFSR